MFKMVGFFKKLSLSLAASVIFVSIAIPAEVKALSASTPEISVILNNKKMNVSVLPPEKYGRTLFQIDNIFIAAGWKATYFNNGRTLVLVKDQNRFSINEGDTSLSVDGMQYNIDIPVKYINGKLYSSIPFFNYTLGLTAKWSSNNNAYQLQIPDLISINVKNAGDITKQILAAIKSKSPLLILKSTVYKAELSTINALFTKARNAAKARCGATISTSSSIVNDIAVYEYIIEFDWFGQSSARAKYAGQTAPVIKNRADLYKLISSNMTKLNSQAFYFRIGSKNIKYADISSVIDSVQGDISYIAAFIDNVSYGSETNNGKTVYYIKFNYRYPDAETKYMFGKFKNAADTVLKTTVRSGMSQFEKEKALHDYVVKNTKYDEANYKRSTVCSDMYTPYASMILGIGVCNSYASAMQYLLEKSGIECTVATGTSNGVSHAWNIVKIDNCYYHLDTTFDDPIPDRGDEVSYSFFNTTDEEMSVDHGWNREAYPKCSDTKYKDVFDELTGLKGLPHVTNNDDLSLLISKAAEAKQTKLSFTGPEMSFRFSVPVNVLSDKWETKLVNRGKDKFLIYTITLEYSN